LNGKGRGCGQHGRNGQRHKDALSPVDVRRFNEWQADGHEHGAEPHLQQRQRLKRDARRHVAQRDAVECEPDGAAKREHIAKVNGGEIRQQAFDGSEA